MDIITVEAPAKVNLTLDVRYKRGDGYHELETVMHQIGLIDRLTLRRGRSGEINLSSNHPTLPNNQENLAYQAARLILQENGQDGVDIYIEKNIPLGAGLAGGSSDAAAVLWGMNRLFDYQFDTTQLMQLAARLGSDVPFCLLGREKGQAGRPGDALGATAIARGRGELLEEIPGCYLPWVLLVKPDFQISTAEVYRSLRLDELEQRPDTAAFLAAWRDCDIMNIAINLVNVLESVSIKQNPEIAAIKVGMIKYGALKALMSGSGPAVFGIFNEEQKARQARDEFLNAHNEVFLVSSYGRGDKSARTKITTG